MVHNWVTIKIYRETRRKAKEMAAQRELSLADLFAKSLVTMAAFEEICQIYGLDWREKLAEKEKSQ